MTTTSLPKVAILVKHAHGRHALARCISFLKAQTYPIDRLDIRIVNAGPKGWCAQFNEEVRRVDAEFVAFLSDGMRVDPHWLNEMLKVAQRHGTASVASKILDRTGERVEYAGTGLSLVGCPSGRPRTEQLLYSSADASLVERITFLEVGGFDHDFVETLSDVDLGWRLNLRGYTVMLAPAAVAYRDVTEPSTQAALNRQQRLIERNTLMMLYKNYETQVLARVFPSALASCLIRGLHDSGIDTLKLELASRPPRTVNVDPRLIAHLIALEDFSRHLPVLNRKRRAVQGNRRRSDAELFDLFGDPLELDGRVTRHDEAIAALIHDFDLDEIRKPARKNMPSDAAAKVEPNASRAHQKALVSDALPTVSIIILTALGATHLGPCLTSLRSQTYPADRVEVIIVDNASVEDPTTEAQRHYPGVRVIRNSSNTGFAAANNIGADAATGDYLVFLNDDTRVAPDWLREMVQVALRRQAAAVASCIVDWSGRRVDFVEGAINFQGKGFQLNYDAPVKSVWLIEKPLLFACGCAMLVERSVFFDAGRWDQATFAYYEDVELGWRLNLLGHAVWFAPRAVVHHKHHGTSGRWPEPPRLRLYERNSLRMIYALLDTRTLLWALPIALLLTADRALLGTRLSRIDDAEISHNRWNLLSSAKTALRARGVTKKTSIGEGLKRLGIRGSLGVVRDVLVPRRVKSSRRKAYSIRGRGEGPTDARQESIPIEAAAVLSGIYAFLADLPELSARRAEIQRRRRRTDEEILGQFASRWLETSPAPHQAEHDVTHAALIQEIGSEFQVFRESTDNR